MKDIPDILNGLRTSPAILIGLIRSIPQDRLHLKRGEGLWTIAEHVFHLAELQPVMGQRIQAFFDQNPPIFTTHVLPDSLAQDIDVLKALDDFQAGRENVLELLKKTPPAIWEKHGVHPYYTDYDFCFMVRHFLVHDYWHMHRIEALWLGKDEFLKPL